MHLFEGKEIYSFIYCDIKRFRGYKVDYVPTDSLASVQVS